MPQRGRGDEVPSLDERVAELRRVVSLLVRKMDTEFACQLDYAPHTVAYMDAILAEVQASGRPLTPSLFLSIGGYLGETLVHAYGGRWTELDGNLAILLEGEGHSRTFDVFEWVKRAYAEPASKSLTDRIQGMVGDGLGPGGQGSGAASA